MIADGITMSVPVYRGKFSERQASRLLWRAGFGPKPGEAKKLADKGLSKAVNSLLNPPKARLRGPRPRDEDGNFAPNDLWGHDVMWWLDRMIRTNQPLVERMALNWHDWFATGDVGSARLGIKQIKMFQKRGLSSFDQLIEAVTTDPAMLVWLSGIGNRKEEPNENYARELMELFTLGASDPETGYPYSEQDVREQARALTGWSATWKQNVGWTDFRYQQSLHDTGSKTVFGQTGNFGWQDSCRLCLEHEAHAPYLVGKLWSYFIPTPPDDATRAVLEAKYRSNYKIKPLLKAILKHPDFYEGPSMVTPPIVFIAGLMRARKLGVREESWAWISDMAGQRPFRPPNVAGWDEERWLDTSSYRGRWFAASYITRKNWVQNTDKKPYPKSETVKQAVNKALAYWANPVIDAETRAGLEEFAQAVEDAIEHRWQKRTHRALRQNALRMMIAMSPAMQTS